MPICVAWALPQTVCKSMYLAIDLGTTGCRSIVFDGALQPKASAYYEYGTITYDGCRVEQDAALWWELTKKTAKQAIQEAKTEGTSIRCIAISSQGITLLPVDEQLQPLCNALSWLDTRAKAESEQIAAELGEEAMYALTGKPVNACYTLPKLLWLKTHLPHIYEAAFKFLMPLDFLVAKFTGSCVTDHSMASGTLLYDLENQCWSERVLTHYGIPEEKLPRIMQSSDVVGTVLPAVAKELGLSDNCMVAVGAQDQKCAAFGVGLAKDTVTVSLGTAAAITKLHAAVDTTRNAGVGWCGYVQEGQFVTEGVVNTAGTCLRRVRDTLFLRETYERMDAEAAAALTRGASLLFPPFMQDTLCLYSAESGELIDTALVSRGEVALAVMEGVAFRLRVLLETMDVQNQVDTVVLFGGGGSSELWRQIIADITGKRVLVPKTHEAAAAGAARLAALAVGETLPPLTCEKMYQPSAHVNEYNKKYTRYRALENRLLKEGVI